MVAGATVVLGGAVVIVVGAATVVDGGGVVDGDALGTVVEAPPHAVVTATRATRLRLQVRRLTPKR